MIKDLIDEYYSETIDIQLYEEWQYIPLSEFNFFFQESKEFKKKMNQFERELKNNPTYDPEHKTVQVDIQLEDGSFVQHRIPVHILIESKNNKKNNRLVKFLEEHNYDPFTSTIETDTITELGKKKRVKFYIGHHSETAQPIEGSAFTTNNRTKDQIIKMRKRDITQRPSNAEFAFRHEEGHSVVKDERNKESITNDDIPKSMNQDFKNAEKFKQKNEGIGEINKHLDAEEFLADKYAASKVGVDNAIRALRNLSIDFKKTDNQRMKNDIKDQINSQCKAIDEIIDDYKKNLINYDNIIKASENTIQENSGSVESLHLSKYLSIMMKKARENSIQEATKAKNNAIEKKQMTEKHMKELTDFKTKLKNGDIEDAEKRFPKFERELDKIRREHLLVLEKYRNEMKLREEYLRTMIAKEKQKIHQENASVKIRLKNTYDPDKYIN